MNWEKRVKLSVISVLVLLVIFVLIPGTGASFWAKQEGFYYSPNYGQLKTELDRFRPFFDVTGELGPGMGASLSLGYDLSTKWAIRLDSFSFSKSVEYRHLDLPETFVFKTSTAPVILSVVRRFPTKGALCPYLAVGGGIFFSELIIQDISYQTFEKRHTDSPLGFQLLLGVDYRLTDRFLLSGELRYLTAEAQHPGYKGVMSGSTDWSGSLVSVGIKYGSESGKIRGVS